ALRERHPQVGQAQERPGGHGRLGQGVVTVHRAAGEERAGHLMHRVGFLTGQGELVVGLLVRAGVAAGAGADLVGDHDDAVLAELPGPGGGGEPGRAGAYLHRIGADHRDVVAGDGQRGGGVVGVDVSDWHGSLEGAWWAGVMDWWGALAWWT